MHSKLLRQMFGDGPHHVRRVPVYSINEAWKVERLLQGPDRFVLVRGKDFGRRPDSDPTNGNGRTRRQMAAQMHRPIDPDFRPMADDGAVENGGPRGDKNFTINLCADNMAVGPDHAMIPDRAVMTAGGANDGVFENDAMMADPYRSTAFCDESGAMHDPATRADRHVSADGGVRRDPCVGVDGSRTRSIGRYHFSVSCRQYDLIDP
jgi:hypothetical protein